MGDPGKLVINFGSLAQAAQDINHAINSMESELSNCEQAAQPLISTWEGAAQEAYGIRQAKWRSAAGDLTQMLRDIKAAVEESASSFQSAEDRNRALFE
ncbi:MAG TPA: WXG100 family type VII secretion target [Candidatus Limnocylindrales bacterium]|nr:WXG100 family type VII secretion target [Candidatus Limnocylindrales bacterium]